MNGGDQNTGFIPARLMEVGPSSLRLVEQREILAGPMKQPEYCALSYCWGPREDARLQAKTTEETHHEHMKRLVFDKLPQVLQDAVTTTRNLSIPYLWVDSLCIMQGNQLDWEEQCTHMSDVYGNARVTLIAASSRTCTEGFLKPKRPAFRFPYQSARRPEISGSFMMYFTHVYEKPILRKEPDNDYRMDLHNDLRFSQWARRGWTFQEQAMAKAQIVFGTSGVYFGRDGQYVATNGTAEPEHPQASMSSLQTNQELHQAWEKILVRYSACKESSFTEIKDLLPALSGLARQFGNKLQFENKLPVKYVAGHWVDRLHYTLLWVTHAMVEHPSLDDIRTRHSQEEYLIPTWSCLTRNTGGLQLWLSSIDQLHGQYGRYRSEFEILDVQVQLAGSDPYGAMESALLTLEGFVLDLGSLTWSESPEKLVGALDTRTEIRFPRYPVDTFDIVDRTGEVEQCSGQSTKHHGGDFPPLASDDSDSSSRDEPHSGGCNSRGLSPDSGDHDRCGYQRDSVYPYYLDREYQPKNGVLAEPGDMRASFDELISRVVLFLLASEDMSKCASTKEPSGYGLMLLRLDGAPQNSFLRVGSFRPRVTLGGLSSLKRLMNKETIMLL